ncbi:MAG: hypothetical protein LKE47_02205 [Prevotella sp.]|nr:hypothetical protein [Prevotella sp.]MCH3969251.1 hypothetical protein [Prevotella sp.]MCH4017534.1 hypothetical protein [Prevotella sp.]MCH4251174.1 hypothetical protein [Prevotella sp.]MCI1323937.1 hypothetical protein [Prevotella sp.]MCI1350063.1 hypothetical protein [Prevotella sp.]
MNMKIYLYINKSISKIDIWRDYMSAVSRCDHTDQLSEADLLHLLGAWDYRASRLAGKARKMGIPYIFSPLGGITPWNMRHPAHKRFFQRLNYQKSMIKYADAVLVTTPLEMQYLKKLKWNFQLYRIPNPVLTHLLSEEEMRSKMEEVYARVLSRHEKFKAEQIRRLTGNDSPEHLILRQLLQIQSRMPHQNIPQEYFDALQSLLHDTDYDDDLLTEQIKKLKMEKFSRRVFQVMTSRTGLTEGFMPEESLEDRKTKTMLKYCRPQEEKKKKEDES